MRRVAAAVVLACALSTAAADKLTLEQALASVAAPHPDRRIAESDLDIARAERALAGSQQDFALYLDGNLRRGRRPDDGWKPDNALRIVARKPLLDFGRSSGAVDAAEQEIVARQAALINVENLRRIDVMARYFDVLLADMRYAADNEFMAVGFVSLENARDRLDVGQISQPELMRREAEFQDLRERRNASLQRLRATRQALAHAINRPGELPVELVEPALEDNGRPVAAYESLLAAALKNNPRMRVLTAQLAAVDARIAAVRADRRPMLAAEVVGADYSRESTTRDDVSAGLVFSVPLYQGGRIDAREARERAAGTRLRAELDKLRFDLAEALLATRQEIEWLRDSGRPAADTQIEFRDWALERARAEYELELRTNLGNSMAETQTALLRKKQVEYRLALAFARLEALSGGRLPPVEGAAQ